MRNIIFLFAILALSANFAHAKSSHDNQKKTSDKQLVKASTKILKNAFLKNELEALVLLAEYPVRTNEFSEDGTFQTNDVLRLALNKHSEHFHSIQAEKGKGWQLSCFKTIKMTHSNQLDDSLYSAECKPLKFTFKKIDNHIKLIGIFNSPQS